MKTNENNYQKIKLLKIMEILRETDEEHALRTSEICRRLRYMEITCDTRTLGKDMRFLVSQGYDIQYRMQGHEKAYYTEDSGFSVPEVKILMDAVQAASFITEKKTGELINKISSLAGIHKADVLSSNLIHFNAHKHSNEAVYYTVANLEEALRKGKKVTFHYFDLDENGSRVFRKNGERYTEEPMGLVFYEDNYYLICYHHYFGHPFAFRIDRMCDVDLSEQDISPKVQELSRETDFTAFTEKLFKMYGGEEKAVSIRFLNRLIGTVYDKFGEDTPMKRIDDDVVEALVKVEVSEMFFGWVSQFPGWMEITWPESVIREYKEHISKMNRICREK